MVRDSFAKRGENTFKNRCRFLCKGCWNAGNPHRRCRFKDKPISLQDGSSRYNFAPGQGEFCTCTHKDDGWVCISCKDMQNAEATTSGFMLCFGEGCTAVLEEDKDRRRICLWCDRPMLRGRASMESKLAFDQKMQDARAERGISFEEGTRKRQKLYKMSRRELRGDEAVAHDPEADAPQFVRHLDTTNYQRFMRREQAPSGQQVYQSKSGRWVYHREFLLEIGRYCKRMPKRDDVRVLTRGDGMRIERTNLEKSEEQDQRRRMKKHGQKYSMTSVDSGSGNMLHLRDNDKAEATALRGMRRFSFLPNKTKAIEQGEPSIHQSESVQDVSDDYMVALALQAQLDREMADALNAEFVADVAEAACLQILEHEPEDTESDQYSIHPLKSQISAPNENEAVLDIGHASQDNDNETLLAGDQAQLKMCTAGQTPNLEDKGNHRVPPASGSLVAPEEVAHSEAGGGDLSEPATSQTRPKPNADQLG
jgi:hypothetical protein